MAQDLSKKKAAFLTSMVNAGVAWKTIRDDLKTLAEEWNTNGDISSIVQDDIDVAVTHGAAVGHLTPLDLANVLTVAQPDWEKVLAGTPVTPTGPELIHFLRLLPN
jgi:hypothetical protein